MINFKQFAIIVSNTIRSKIYISELIKNNLIPQEIIYLDNNKKRHRLKFNNKFNSSKIYKIISISINSKKVIDKILKIKTKNIIFSSYGGDIIRNEIILKKKNFIHCHPGKLPFFKGSAVYYYSLLKQKKIFYTTFVLNKKIDGGKIIRIKEYKDLNINKFNEYYDAMQRINNIMFVMKKNLNNNRIILHNKNKKNNENMYYIPHPIIRYLAKKSF